MIKYKPLAISFTYVKLKEFLKTYRSEVTKSMQLNYEFDRQLELERADAIEEGMEIGIEKGIEKGANKMLFKMYPIEWTR